MANLGMSNFDQSYLGDIENRVFNSYELRLVHSVSNGISPGLFDLPGS